MTDSGRIGGGEEGWGGGDFCNFFLLISRPGVSRLENWRLRN
jgi:hypothetical protein